MINGSLHRQARCAILRAMALRPGSVHGVSFDYGNVLGALDYGVLASRLAAFRVAPSPETLRRAADAAKRAHDDTIAHGGDHPAAWRAHMRVLVRAGGVREERVGECVEQLWQRQRRENLWRDVSQEARAIVETLDRAKIPLVLSTNSEGGAADLLADLDLARHFRAVLDSGQLGYGKPGRRIFDDAARELGVAVDHMLHIGDSESADVVGAKAAGALALRFDGVVHDPAPTVADAVAHSYRDLRAALEVATARDL